MGGTEMADGIESSSYSSRVRVSMRIMPRDACTWLYSQRQLTSPVRTRRLRGGGEDATGSLLSSVGHAPAASGASSLATSDAAFLLLLALSSPTDMAAVGSCGPEWRAWAWALGCGRRGSGRALLAFAGASRGCFGNRRRAKCRRQSVVEAAGRVERSGSAVAVWFITAGGCCCLVDCACTLAKKRPKQRERMGACGVVRVDASAVD